MLHSDHIDGRELYSYFKAHSTFMRLREDAKKKNLPTNEIKLLTKRDIICNNLGTADAMVVWASAPPGYMQRLVLGEDGHVCWEIHQTSIYFYDI